MSRKFIAALGTGEYKVCNYEFNGEVIETRYIQKAIADIFCKEWDNKDKIVIYTTTKARKKHWDFENSLKSELQENTLDLTNIDIPEGKNEEEIWEIFSKIYDSLEEDDEVIVDITHGFRSIPMLLIIILNYAKVLKNIKVRGIYYGAYEAKSENEEGKEVTPIFDLILYDLIMDFTNGIGTFLNTGNSIYLSKLCSNLKEEARKFSNNSSFDEINKTVQSLNDFSNSIMTCRGNVNLYNKCKSKKIKNGKKSIAGAYLNFINNLNEYENKEVNNEVKDDALKKPLMPLFMKIKEETKQFEDLDPINNGIETIRWCIKNDLIQQGLTALDETIKTFVCSYYKLNPYEINNREDIVSTALNVYNIDKKAWDYKKENLGMIEEILNNKNKELFKVNDKIGKSRNDINHFGMNNNAKDSDALKKDLIKNFNKFVNVVNSITGKEYKCYQPK